MYIKNISASSVVKTVICEVDSLIANTSASFGHNRLEEVGAPTSDTDAATKKYVDDMGTDTMSYVDAQNQALLSQIDTLSTQAGQIISILVAEMSEEEIPFRVIYNEDNNSKMLTVGQERALHFIFPASLHNHTDLITEVKLTFSCRKITGYLFFGVEAPQPLDLI
jgi:predicted regulator of Ras-like GTPase activity (Roadblock/LC7/MglB family)